MKIEQWQENWNVLGKDDPLWVVLTDPSKKGGRWEPSEFFASGIQEIEAVLADIEQLDGSFGRGRALDFGCGVGRLSQALADHFDEVHGVDISPSMIGHAERFNQHPGKCHFHLNGCDNLKIFSDDHFDFIYSNITLQHIEGRFAKQYIREFIRVLKPGGLAVFQVVKPGWLRALVPDAMVMLWRRIKHKDRPFIGMFGIADGEIAELLRASGATVLRLDRMGTGMSRWLQRRYFVTKAPTSRSA